jgi:hypothetical protein
LTCVVLAGVMQVMLGYLDIDCSRSRLIASDVAEIIKNYESSAKTKNISVEKINFI